MKKLLIAILISLGGCAMSPKEVKEYGYQFLDVSNASPLKTAGCLARNAANLPGALFTVQQVRPGALELLVNETHDSPNTLSVWRIHNLSHGSRLTVYVSPRFIADPEAHFVAIKGTC